MDSLFYTSPVSRQVNSDIIRTNLLFGVKFGVDKRDLYKVHKLFLSSEPTELQMRLYEAFPRVRGISSQERNKEHFEATSIMGITQTWKTSADETPHQVYFIVPTADEMQWCISGLKNIAKGFFKVLKEKPSGREAKIEGAKMIGELFNHLHIGVPTDFTSSPERWVAFGYKNTDVLAPEWLRKSLLTP